MKWSTATVLSIGIIGYFGIFWTISLANIDISITMDENTKVAIQSLNESIGALEIPQVNKFNMTDCETIIDRQEIWCIN